MPDGYVPRQRPWYKLASVSSPTVLTAPYVESNTNGLTIVVATTVRANNRTLDVVRGDLYIGHAVTILNSLDLKGMGHAFLVSGRGDILMPPDSDLVEKPLAEIYPAFKNFTDGRLQEVCKGKDLASVASKIESMDAMNHSVAAATEEQTAVIDTISEDIAQKNELKQGAARILQRILAACNQMDMQVSELQQLIRGFKI